MGSVWRWAATPRLPFASVLLSPHKTAGRAYCLEPPLGGFKREHWDPHSWGQLVCGEGHLGHVVIAVITIIIIDIIPLSDNLMRL